VEAVIDLGRDLIVQRKLRSYFLNALLNRKTRSFMRWFRETRRRLLRRQHVVSAFLQLDDPYSYLLAHYLPSLAQDYDIELRLYLSEARGGAYQPAPEMLAEYAANDCRRLARELGIHALQLEQDAPRPHHRHPELGRALALTHAGLGGLLGYRLVREHPDPDLPASLHATGQCDTGRLDLAARDAPGLERLQGVLAEVDVGAAVRGAAHPALHLLAILRALGHQHGY